MFLATVGIDFLPLKHGAGALSRTPAGLPHRWGIDRAFSLAPVSPGAAVRFLTLCDRDFLAEAALRECANVQTPTSRRP